MVLKEEVNARDPHVYMMMAREQELRDLFPKHGNLYQKDMQRTSMAPTENSTVTGTGTVCEIYIVTDILKYV